MNSLEEGTVISAGLQTHAFEFRGAVVGGDFMPAGTGAPTLEQIVGEEAHVGAKRLGGDGVLRLGLREGDSRQSEDRDKKSDMH